MSEAAIEKAQVIDDLALECHEMAREKGFHDEHAAIKDALNIFYDTEDVTPEEIIELDEWFHATAKQAELARMHSELSEALEAVRLGNPPDEHIPFFNSFTIELADTVIRILDTAGKYRIPLGAAILAKMSFNAKRPHKHGKNS